MNSFGVYWYTIGGSQNQSLPILPYLMFAVLHIEADNAKEAFLKLYDDGGFWHPFKAALPKWIPYTAIIEVAGPVGTANVKPKSRKGTPEVKKK